jgi:hypothetical protein
MTKGSKARWSAALILAPAAAALFAGTTAWAATNNPLATSASAAKPATTDPVALTTATTNPATTNPPTAVPAIDPATQAQIDAQRAVVKKLQKKVAEAAAAGGRTVQAWTQTTTSGSTSTISTSTGSTSGGSTQTQPAPQPVVKPAPQPVVKPAPQPVPAPAPAPTTQASTGASGG